MILEKIDYSDKENLIKVTISSEVFFLSYDYYNSLDIKKGDELDFNLYKDILREDDYNRCKSYALRQISYSNKTSFDLKKKLQKKDFSNESIDKVIDFLKAYKLIDDRAYVRAYVSDKSNLSLWSKSKIRYKLKSKFISDELIDEYLDQISEKEEYEKALSLGQRRKNLGHNKDKVFRYLANRAFSFSIIQNVIGDLF